MPADLPIIDGRGRHVFLTSDTHYHHANIIKYCQRPFQSVEHMNAEMVRRWNERCDDDAFVIHLGDFCFGGIEKAVNVANSLRGRKVIVRGNHDAPRKGKWGFTDQQLLSMGFEAVYGRAFLDVPEGRFYLEHHPRTYQDLDAIAGPQGMQLCGHVHELWDRARTSWRETEDGKRYVHGERMRTGRVINVGVDQRGFAPATVGELLATGQ